MSRSLASYYKRQDETFLHIFRWLMQDKGLCIATRICQAKSQNLTLTYLSEVCACLFQEEPRGRYFGLLKTVKVSITRKTLVKYLCNRRKQARDLNFLGEKIQKKRKKTNKNWVSWIESDFCLRLPWSMKNLKRSQLTAIQTAIDVFKIA